jgi:hypothetical protein
LSFWTCSASILRRSRFSSDNTIDGWYMFLYLELRMFFSILSLRTPAILTLSSSSRMTFSYWVLMAKLEEDIDIWVSFFYSSCYLKVPVACSRMWVKTLAISPS